MMGTPEVLPIAPALLMLPWVCEVGVLASDSRESFPWQKVPEVVPNEPTVSTPEVVVMIGRPLVEPIAPALVMLPCEWFALALISTTEPSPFLVNNLPSAVLIANSPTDRDPADGTADAVLLLL